MPVNRDSARKALKYEKKEADLTEEELPEETPMDSGGEDDEPSKEITIGLPPGIGDVYWALMKFPAIKDMHPDCTIRAVVQSTGFNRSKEFLLRFPFVHAVDFKRFSVHPDGEEPVNSDGSYNYVGWGEDKFGLDYVIVPNGHLERGGKLEDWWPEVESDVEIANQYEFYRGDFAFHQKLMTHIRGDYAVFYLGPKIGNTTAGHNRGPIWTIDNWRELGHRINVNYGMNVVLVGSGQEDLNMANEFTSRLANSEASYYFNCVGHTEVTEVYALAWMAKFVVGYPSGIPIFSAALKIPTVCWLRKYGDPISERHHITFHDDMVKNMIPDYAHDGGTYLPLIYGEQSPEEIISSIEGRGWPRRRIPECPMTNSIPTR